MKTLDPLTDTDVLVYWATAYVNAVLLEQVRDRLRALPPDEARDVLDEFRDKAGGRDVRNAEELPPRVRTALRL